MKELELKIELDEKEARKIWKRALAEKLAEAEPAPRKVTSTYFDTPDHALRQSGISLRLRNDAGKWVQTIKAARSMRGGFSSVSEFETELDKAGLDLKAFGETDLSDQITSITAKQSVEPRYETEVARTEGKIERPDDFSAMLTVDECVARAGDKSERFHELEIELSKGSPGDLFEIARKLLPQGGGHFSRMAKADRGYLLLETGHAKTSAAPREARTVPLKASIRSAKAAERILTECAEQIAANLDILLVSDAPEGPHQLRIGLRRLRSALTIAKPALGLETCEPLSQEAKWLGAEVGRLRDLDVVSEIIAEAAAHNTSGKGDFAGLQNAIASEVSSTRGKLRKELTGARALHFMLDLYAFIETVKLHAGKKGSGGGTAHFGAIADKLLDRRWNKVCTHAHGIEHLSLEERHALRKELKKLRYTTEFLAPLYPRKHAKPFVSRLKKLQDVFGDLNDATMLSQKFDELGFVRSSSRKIHQAIGWAQGYKSARAEEAWQHARKSWRNLKETDPFWR